ncbi:hypothetical protein DM47_1972 [Burkholderia mallei]|nr:hypothetical protein DM53_4060 [Burkholderia mallei]KOT18097.1 hypothetical protein DM47_1972 [Burkholderia mallei]KOT20761.1 hypothetical protein DM52_1330 [Burkholderia mallei]
MLRFPRIGPTRQVSRRAGSVHGSLRMTLIRLPLADGVWRSAFLRCRRAVRWASFGDADIGARAGAARLFRYRNWPGGRSRSIVARLNSASAARAFAVNSRISTTLFSVSLRSAPAARLPISVTCAAIGQSPARA